MSFRRKSEVQRLLEQLQQAEQRAGQAEQRALAEQQARQTAEQQALAERRRNRLTTFEEFIRCAHNHLSKPLEVQTDKSLSTKGSITSPKNRMCPIRLRPWTEFPQT